MTPLLLPRLVVARHLGLDPDRIDPDCPLASYGMDSLRSMELVAALEDATGRRLPESFCLDHPTLNRLAGALAGRAADVTPWTTDARLPDDFVVAQGLAPSQTPRNIFLTGATGLVGAYLLRTLIDETDAQVWCLVRCTAGEGLARIRTNLAQFGLWRESLAGRIEIVRGDLGEPRLGLSPTEYQGVAMMTDAVLHAGADVDWVQPYAALRRVNVIGTVEVLRLAAAGRPKPVQFVSSLSVCYLPGGPPIVNEATDCLPFIDHLPLGYAQTKCVAEALCQEASARGLPMRVLRPALVAGDSRTGASNADDLIGRLVRGCIQMQAAPDLDWSFDAVPADELARAIVRAPWPTDAAFERLHVVSPRPRAWQECVMWINLLGYQCRLIQFEEWRSRLGIDCGSSSHPLSPLRPFFSRRGECASAAELCQVSVRSAVAQLDHPPTGTASMSPRGMDAAMLARQIDGYVMGGMLRPSGRKATATGQQRPIEQRPRDLEALLEPHFGNSFAIRAIEAAPGEASLGIISDLSSWRRGTHSGITRLRLTIERNGRLDRLPVVVKAKAHDDDALEAARALADTCGERVGREVTRFEDGIGLRGAGNREIALYQHQDERLRRYTPTCYGVWPQTAVEGAGLVLEDLHAVATMNATDPAAWRDTDIDAVLHGLADIHAAGLGLRGHAAFAATRAPADVRRMAPLWSALAEHAVPLVETAAGRSLASRHAHLADTVDAWSAALEASELTVIHHDFSPRNAALRSSNAGDVLSAYDWELATVGLPQRDLAEFLCFALPADVDPMRFSAIVDRHRCLLARASARPWPRGDWQEGLRAALALLLVDRFAFYALIHRVRPQAFLTRVLRTWQRLDALASSPFLGAVS